MINSGVFKDVANARPSTSSRRKKGIEMAHQRKRKLNKTNKTGTAFKRALSHRCSKGTAPRYVGGR